MKGYVIKQFTAIVTTTAVGSVLVSGRPGLRNLVRRIRRTISGNSVTARTVVTLFLCNLRNLRIKRRSDWRRTRRCAGKEHYLAAGFD